MKYRTVAATVIVLASLSIPSLSAASFHLVKIREVFPGTAGDPNAQYVMLQMYSAGQNLVSGHTLTVYDAAGAPAGTFTFPGNVANGANQSYILLATGEAQTLFSITADLVISASITAGGGKVCFEDIDCVAWGSFMGSANNPSPSGTPFGFPDGLLDGHAIRRDISHGNASTLQGGDDTDDSADDFDCVATAQPINNAGTMAAAPYTDPTPCSVCGNDSQEFGEQCDGIDAVACPGGCQTNCLCPAHDSVVLPVKPIKIKLRSGIPASVTKNVKVRVLNADVAHGGNDTIALAASSDCPAGVTVGTPDFDGGDSSVVDAGRTASAIVAVTVTDSAFTTFNAKAPKRCTLTFESTTIATNPPGGGGSVNVVGNLDPTPDNNVMTAELNVFDANDAASTSPPHESFTTSLKPIKITIASGKLEKAKKVKPAAGNADILPAPDQDTIDVTVDVSACPGPPSVALDMNRKIDGDQSSTLVAGGRSGKGALLLTFAAADVTTPNNKSPQRCSATITATGPTDPDPDTTNNTTTLVIDLLDKNDF